MSNVNTYSVEDVEFLEAELRSAAPQRTYVVGLFDYNNGIGIAWEFYIDDTQHRGGVALRGSTPATKQTDLRNLLDTALNHRYKNRE